MRFCVLLLLACASALFAEPKLEIGDLNGAAFRIDVPENWNGTLVVYCHGYNAAIVKFDPAKPSSLAAGFAARGYAVIQSGYSSAGWAIKEAMEDTEALRRYFVRKYGAPKKTLVTGHSMGGLLTVALVESLPEVYDQGGLALCGALGPPLRFIEHHAFDMRVVFDYLFPNVLPNPANVPADFMMGPERNAAVLSALETKPEAAAVVRRLFTIRTNKELAGALVFFTYILKELQQRSAGNPFDNRDTVYVGSDDDNALNDGVARYERSPRAANYLERYYQPTGKLMRNVLAIHNTYDALVPGWVTTMYGDMVHDAGAGDRFVQTYVKRDGHCNISGEEIARGVQLLEAWNEAGARPPSGALR